MAPLTPRRTGVFSGARTDGLRPAATSGGWSPTVHLFSQVKGKLAWDEVLGCFRPDKASRPALGRRLQRHLRPGQACDRRGLGGRRPGAAKHAGFKRKTPQEAQVRGRGPRRACRHAGSGWCPRTSPWARAASTSSTSRTTSPPPTSSWPCARAIARSSTSSATPPPAWARTRARPPTSRHRHRRRGAGPPLPEVGVTTFRPPYTPVTFGAIFAGRDVDDCSTRLAQDADARLARAPRRALRGRRPVAPPLVLPAQRRGPCTPPLNREVRRRCAARWACLDASTWARSTSRAATRRASQPHLHQRLEEARNGRPLPLRPDAGEDGMVMDDGVTARLGEHRFLMTTTTGNAAAGAGPPGRMAADRVAGARGVLALRSPSSSPPSRSPGPTPAACSPS